MRQNSSGANHGPRVGLSEIAVELVEWCKLMEMAFSFQWRSRKRRARIFFSFSFSPPWRSNSSNSWNRSGDDEMTVVVEGKEKKERRKAKPSCIASSIPPLPPAIRFVCISCVLHNEWEREKHICFFPPPRTSDHPTL